MDYRPEDAVIRASRIIRRAIPAHLLFVIMAVRIGCKGEEMVYLNLRHLNQVDYADSAAVLAMWDELHAASTLQGIVNRKKPRLYVDYVTNGQRAIDAHWWNLYRQRGNGLQGATHWRFPL